MAGFFFSADPRNFFQSSGMVGGGSFVQQNPFGMVSPAQYGMVSSTPYGMVNPSAYGMVSSSPYGMVNPTAYGMVNSSPYVGLVAQPQRQVTMCPSFAIEMSPFVRSPSSGFLAIQCNDTDDVDTPRMRTPYLEEVRDNTQLVPRKPKVSPSVQKDTYALDDCKKYLDNLSQKISDSEKRIAESRNVIVDSVKVFADLKEKRNKEVSKKEKDNEKHEKLLRKLRGLKIDKDSSRKCTICMDREKNAVILPCGHTTCMECATEVYLESNQRCPICRADIEDINPLYFD